MNSTENLWPIVKINVAKRRPKNKLQLEKFTIEEWNKIDKKTCKRLVQTINNHCRAVIGARGGHTNY